MLQDKTKNIAQSFVCHFTKIRKFEIVVFSHENVNFRFFNNITLRDTLFRPFKFFVRFKLYEANLEIFTGITNLTDNVRPRRPDGFF